MRRLGFASDDDVQDTPAEHRREQLREKIKTVRLERKHLQERNELKALKEASALDVSDWVDPWTRLLDDLRGEGRDWAPILSPSARKRGDMYPMFQNEQQHALIRDVSRITAVTNNHAIGLLNGTESFVIGDQMTLQVLPGPGGSKDEAAKVQDFLDGWAEEDLWAEHQQEIFSRSRFDGEAFVRVFADDELQLPTIRYIWPEQITKPRSANDDEWSYGIFTPNGDIAKPVAYWVADPRDAANGEPVPADEIQHIKVNVVTGVKRGLPDFSFATKDTFAEAARLTKNLGAGAAAREAVAWVQEHENATKGEIEGWVQANADRQRPKFSRTGKMQNVTVDAPATVYNVPAMMKLVAMAGPAGGAVHVAVVQLLLRSAGIRWNAPEWLTSGDASAMGAYTASLVAESPFVRRVKKEQGFYRRRLLRILKLVLRVAAEMGLLNYGVEKRVRLELTPPTPEVRNKLEDAQVDQIYGGMGVKSPQRMSRENGWDYGKDVVEINEHFDTMSAYNLPMPVPIDPRVKVPGTTIPGPAATGV